MILDKLDFNKEWGTILNRIQTVVCSIFDDDEYEEYSRKSSSDFYAAEGMDGVIFNGQYFDWKEFETKKKEIVSAYLRYFTDEQLSRIEKAL